MSSSSGYGGLWRQPPEPTLYPAHIRPPIDGVDLPLWTAGSVVALLLLATLAALPGFNVRRKKTVALFGAVVAFLGILAVLLAGFFSQGWYAHVVRTRAPFRAFDKGREIVADVGIHVGLDGINVTCRGVPRRQLGHFIDYEEHYEWDGNVQGRLGFGPNAGRIFQEFRESQFRGVPTPVQYVAEWFILDGEGQRWGRYYRMGGYYCKQFLYVASLSYLATAMLYGVASYRAASWTLLSTGVWMVAACVVNLRVSERLVLPLRIPFRDATLEPRPSWCFWWTFSSGLLCVAGAAASFAYLRAYGGDRSGAEKDSAAAFAGAGGGPGGSDHMEVMDEYTMRRIITFQNGGGRAEQFDYSVSSDEEEDDEPGSARGAGSNMEGSSSSVQMAASAPRARPAAARGGGGGGEGDVELAEAPAPAAPPQTLSKGFGGYTAARFVVRCLEVTVAVVAFSALVADRQKVFWLGDEWERLASVAAILSAVLAGFFGAGELALSWCVGRLRTTPSRFYGAQLAADTFMCFVCFAAGSAALGEKYDDVPEPGLLRPENPGDGRPPRDVRSANGESNSIITAHYVLSVAWLLSLALSHKVYNELAVRGLRKRTLRRKRV